MRTACSATPDTTAHTATVVRLSVHARMSAPWSSEPSSASPATRTPSSVIEKSGSWFIVCWRVAVMPDAFVGTRNIATLPSTFAGTSTSSAAVTPGTFDFAPLITQPSPSRVAVVVGDRGSAPISTSAAVSSTSPLATLARIACCASEPKRAMGIAPATSVDTAGSGDTLRPTSRSTMQRSRNPKPSPPADSGNAMPSRFAFANSCHVGRSYQSSERSRSFRCWRPERSSRMRAARPRSSSWFSLREKSILRAPPDPVFSAGCRACRARRSRSGLAASRWCRRRT